MDTYHKRQSITRLCTNHGWKGSGILSARDGTWDDHVKYLIDEK